MTRRNPTNEEEEMDIAEQRRLALLREANQVSIPSRFAESARPFSEKLLRENRGLFERLSL